MTRDDIMRTHPPINARDFGVPPLFAERAENYALWAVQVEREACAKELETIAQQIPDEQRNGFVYKTVIECVAIIRARGTAPTFSPATLTSPRGSLGEEV